MEICGKCGKPIPDTETPQIDGEAIVCETCKADAVGWTAAAVAAPRSVGYAFVPTEPRAARPSYIVAGVAQVGFYVAAAIAAFMALLTLGGVAEAARFDRALSFAAFSVFGTLMLSVVVLVGCGALLGMVRDIARNTAK